MNSPGLDAIVFGGGGGHNNTIRDNVIQNGGTSLEGNVNQVDFTAIYVDSSDTTVEGNRIMHDNFPFTFCGGIELHGGNSRASGNYVEKSFPAVYVANDGAIGSELGTFEVTGNVFESVLVGIIIAGTGDIVGLTVANNVARTRAFPSLPQQAGSFLLQPRDDTGHFTYSLVLKDTTIASNVHYDLDDAPLVGRTSFANVSAADGLDFVGNQIVGVSGPAFILRGSPYTTRRVTIEQNVIRNYGNNTGSFGKWAIYVDYTGKSLDPLKDGYDLDNLYVTGNLIAQDNRSPNHSVFFFDWSDESNIADISVLEDNIVTNVGAIAVGPRASQVIIHLSAIDQPPED